MDSVDMNMINEMNNLQLNRSHKVSFRKRLTLYIRE